MEQQIKQLKEFHTAFNLPQRDKPADIPLKEFNCRHKLLQEEVDELLYAYNHNDIVGITDAITDCLYVLIGTALQFGLTDILEKCFTEIHHSNMSKLENGKPVMREDGKVLKGKDYKPPMLSKYL